MNRAKEIFAEFVKSYSNPNTRGELLLSFIRRAEILGFNLNVSTLLVDSVANYSEKYPNTLFKSIRVSKDTYSLDAIDEFSRKLKELNKS